MEEVYMNIELGQLKSILETAKKLQNEEKKAPGILKSLIERYNQASQNIGNSNELPPIPPFDERCDAGWGYTNLALDGDKKLVDLITYLDGYVSAHTPIPPTINKVEGWSAKKFWGLTAFVVTSCIAICAIVHQIGVSNGKSETQREYDAEKIQLSKKIETLEVRSKSTNDSLIECKKDNFEKDVSIGLLKVNCNTNTKKPVKGK